MERECEPRHIPNFEQH